MRVLLSTHRSRGDVELVPGITVNLLILGAEAQVCVPPDVADRLGVVGMPLAQIGGGR